MRAKFFIFRRMAIIFAYICFFLSPAHVAAAQTADLVVLKLSQKGRIAKTGNIDINSYASDNEGKFYLGEFSKLKCFDLTGQTIWESEISGQIKKIFVRQDIVIIVSQAELPSMNAPPTETSINTATQGVRPTSVISGVSIKTGVVIWQTTVNRPEAVIGVGKFNQNFRIFMENGAMGELQFAAQSPGSAPIVNFSRRPFPSGSYHFAGEKQKTDQPDSDEEFNLYYSPLNFYLVDDSKEQLEKLLGISSEQSSASAHSSTDVLAAVNHAKKLIFTANGKGAITAFDYGSGKKRWELKIGGGVNNLYHTTVGLLVNSADNFLYLINETNGNKLWKQRMNGRIGSRYFTACQLMGEEVYAVYLRDESRIELRRTRDGLLLQTVSFDASDEILDFKLENGFLLVNSSNFISIYAN